MKKRLLSLMLISLITVTAFAQTISVTFQVMNPNSAPVYVFGSWSGWSDWPGTPMTSVGNDTYEATLDLLPGTTYEYLFVSGAGPATESLNPAWPCTNGNPQYTNRVLVLGNSNTSVCFEWATCNSCGGTTLTPVDLPVTFDDPNVNYALFDFGGNASSIQPDPVDPGNMVCKVIKSNTAEFWAGTTIGGAAGFANPVPFAPGATQITMMVYSPDAGIPVRMKVEDPNDANKSVEAEVLTTMANAWETLTFNFTNQVPGTQVINFSYNYQKLSVFFNFGTTGAVAGTKTYYFDDVAFGPSGPANPFVTFQVHNPAGTPVFVFGSWSGWVNWPGEPMTFIGDDTYEATLMLTAGTTYEYLFVSGSNPDKEMLDPSWPCTNGNGQYTNRVLVTGNNDSTMCFNWGSCSSCGTAAVTGVVSYQNAVSSPMSNTTVYLCQGTDTLDMSVTNQGGAYSFFNVADGDYTLKSSTSKTWGGGNAVDGLLMLEHFIGMAPLTALPLTAGDCNNSGYVNSSDALSVMKRSVGLISSFPTGDWAFENPLITAVAGNIHTQDIAALCFGDVNGSNIPELKVQPSVSVEKSGTVVCTASGICEIPVRLRTSGDVSAISLNLEYSAAEMEFIELIPSPGLQHNDVFVVNHDGNSIRIAWCSLKEMSLSENEILFTMKVRLLNGNSPEFLAGGESCIAGIRGNIHTDSKLLIPEVLVNSFDFTLECCTPNPFSDATAFSILLPEKGQLTIRVVNILGEEVKVVTEGNEESGVHTFHWDGSDMKAGVYLVLAEFVNENSVARKIQRIVKE